MKMLQIRFKELADAKEISKTQCAKDIGISYKTFSNVYNFGKLKQTIIIIQIAKYFDVSTDYLLGLSDSKNKKKPE